MSIAANNPLNLCYVPGVKWDGLANPPNAGRFCSFVTPQYGFRAAAKQVKTDHGRGLDTIAKLIPSWAPASDDNPTAAYTKDVELWSGIGTRALVLPEDLLPLFRAMTRQEDGSNPYPDSVIQEGIDMAQPNAVTQHVADNAKVYGGLFSGASVAGFIAYELNFRFHVQLSAPEITALGLVTSAILAQLFPKGVPGQT